MSELRLGGTGLLPIAVVRPAREHRLLLRTDAAGRDRALSHDGDRIAAASSSPAACCLPPCAVHHGWTLPAQPTRVVLAPAPAFRGLRVVMKNRDAPQPVVTPAAMTDESPVERVLTVPSESDPVIAAVRENQNEGWVASVPGAGSAIPRHRGRLAAGLASRGTGGARGALLRTGPSLQERLGRGRVPAGAAGRSRRGPPSASSEHGRTSRVAVGSPRCRWSPPDCSGLGVMAGWWALLCGVAARWWLPWPVAGSIPTSSPGRVVCWSPRLRLFYWLRPLGSADGWAGTLSTPQLLVAAALGVLAVGRPDSTSDLPRFLRRIAGRSTSR